MPGKSYFLTFIYFDTKHQRTNKFSHLSIALMEGEKASNGRVSDMNLLSCYGYYSHKMPNEGSASRLDKFLLRVANINFRLHNFYAEFKEEDLISLDLGFGIKGGPLLEISADEKNVLEQKFAEIRRNEAQFFAEADQQALQKVTSMGIDDPRKRKAVETEMRNLYRENFYKKELETIDDYIKENKLQLNLTLVETAFASGLISAYRFQQEKLRLAKKIEFFEFTFNPQGRTCKTMGLELVLNSLSDKTDQAARKKYLAELFSDQYFTRSLPLASKDSAKIIYHSQQSQYHHKQNRPPLPDRHWGDGETDCKLAVFDMNKYMDLNGNEQQLRDVAHPKIYNHLIENLIHLQRLLNDFCNPDNSFQSFLTTIDCGIREMIANANSIRSVIVIYHETLKTLDRANCFTEICKNIFNSNKTLGEIKNLSHYLEQQHIKIEDGVKVELKRLLTMEKQAKQDSLLQDLLPNQQSLMRFFSACFHENPSPVETTQPIFRP